MSTQPAITRGWIRALLLLILYLGFSAAGVLVFGDGPAWYLYGLLLAIMLVVFFRRVIEKKKLRPFAGARIFSSVMAGMSFGTLLISLCTLALFAAGFLEWLDFRWDTFDFFYSAALMMTVSLTEEIVFRGYVLYQLNKSMNPWLALIISSLLFSAAHLSNPGVPVAGLINTFLGGVLMGLAFLKAGHLWVATGIHFSWNFVQGPVLGFPVSGMEFGGLLVPAATNAGGEYGLEGSWFCTATLVLGIVFWQVMGSSTKKPFVQSAELT